MRINVQLETPGAIYMVTSQPTPQLTKSFSRMHVLSEILEIGAIVRVCISYNNKFLTGASESKRSYLSQFPLPPF